VISRGYWLAHFGGGQIDKSGAFAYPRAFGQMAAPVSAALFVAFCTPDSN